MNVVGAFGKTNIIQIFKIPIKITIFFTSPPKRKLKRLISLVTKHRHKRYNWATAWHLLAYNDINIF